MGKRSSFERVERDFYPTPYAAVKPLFWHLTPGTTFDEPCAGNGALVGHLERAIKCAVASDIEPMADSIGRCDAFDITEVTGDIFITNSPWSRDILHPLILHLSSMAPTWLLFDADWMHTLQAIPYLARCEKIVSIGCVKWIKNSKQTGKDNCCWYLFGNKKTSLIFYPRGTI